MNSEDKHPKPLLALHYQRTVDPTENRELKYQEAYTYSRKYNNTKYNVYKFHKKL